MSIKDFFAKKKGKEAGENLASDFTLSLSMPLALSIGLALACIIAWTFYLGFMVGKGENPQAEIGSMTGFMGGDKAQNPETADTAEPSPPPPADAPAQVPSPALAAASGDTAQKPYPFGRPQGEQKGAWGETDDNSSARTDRPSTKKAPAKAAAKAAPKGPLYDYTFQVAAYKSGADAANLKKKLTGAGLKAREQKSGKVVLVMVNMRGSDSELASLRQKLQSFKLGKPLLISKKEVAAPKNKKTRGSK